MATKLEMITFIIGNSDKYHENYLNTLSNKKLENLYNEIELKNSMVVKTDEVTPEIIDEVTPEIIDEFTFDDILEDILEDGNDGSIHELNEIHNEPEKIINNENVWDFNKLSNSDKRLYLRTGIKHVTTPNIYKRFYDEKPKI